VRAGATLLGLLYADAAGTQPLGEARYEAFREVASHFARHLPEAEAADPKAVPGAAAAP
jgi:hypothetical protein